MLTKRALLAVPFALLAGPVWADASAFAVGQVWTLKAPAHLDGRIRIGRIDGSTIHISLWGVPAPVPQATDVRGSPLVAAHLPITSEALQRSVDRLTSDAPPSILNFEAGYQTWQRDANGSVFTITVHEIIDVVMTTILTGEARQE